MFLSFAIYSIITSNDRKYQENKAVQIKWPYSNLSPVKSWNTLKGPAAGYPASTWPLSASSSRIGQTYGKK